MKKSIALFSLVILMSMSFSSKQLTNDETIHFASLNYAIQQGQFDGITTVGALKSSGDFGLGSESKLKGELIVLDGIFYSVNAEGKARVMTNDDSIAYAALKSFRSDFNFKAERISSIKDLEKSLAERIDQNAFAAIKIQATFRTIRFRSFEEQTAPYRPVDKVPEIKFERENIKGTMVGFYTPTSAEVLNSPTFHFHFMDDQKTTGGHVLDVDLEKASIDIDLAKEVHIQLPDVKSTEHVDLNTKIKSKG
jgi:acetolactate decarboxylase